MELPCKEEDEEEVVGVPKSLKVAASAFLHGKPNHDSKTGGHNPPSSSRTGCKVCLQKDQDTLTSSLSIGVKHSEFLEVAHVSGNMDDCEDNHGPRRRFVEGDVFVERNELVQRCPTKEGDEITTDGQKDEDDIGVKHESGRTSDGYNNVLLSL